jgi:hypothetical protein
MFHGKKMKPPSTETIETKLKPAKVQEKKEKSATTKAKENPDAAKKEKEIRVAKE